MKGGIFFFLFTFFLASVVGHIFGDFIGSVIDFKYIILKGPWDVNIGILVMIGFLIFYISKLLYKGDRMGIFRIIYDTVVISFMSLVYMFIIGIEFSFNLFSCVFISYFTLFHILYICMNMCLNLFSNDKYKNEQNLLLFLLAVIFVLVVGDVTLFLINKI